MVMMVIIHIRRTGWKATKLQLLVLLLVSKIPFSGLCPRVAAPVVFPNVSRDSSIYEAHKTSKMSGYVAALQHGAFDVTCFAKNWGDHKRISRVGR